jgi:hypothetical protein
MGERVEEEQRHRVALGAAYWRCSRRIVRSHHLSPRRREDKDSNSGKSICQVKFEADIRGHRVWSGESKDDDCFTQAANSENFDILSIHPHSSARVNKPGHILVI